MNGPADYTEHFTAAKECMAVAIEERSAVLMDAAMVHAQLATAAALAAAFAIAEQADTPIYDELSSRPAELLVPLCHRHGGAGPSGPPCEACIVARAERGDQDGATAVLADAIADGTPVIVTEDQADEPADDSPALVRPFVANL